MKKNTSFITKAYRVLYLLTYIVSGLLITVSVFPWIGVPRKNVLVQWWSRHIMRALNISVHAHGQRPSHKQQQVLFVANHVSWVDIFALNSVIPLRFVAKSEIRDWPIIGYLAAKANTLFIQRDKRHHANRMNDTIAQSLTQGDNLCLFPEGTTTNGHQVHPFKVSLFQAAIDAKTVVWPLAIRYPNENGKADLNMAYADDTSLLDSFRTILSLPNPKVDLFFLTPISAESVGNRQSLAAASRDAIIQCLEK